MTSKERITAAVKMQPVDRLPLWPKLDGSYPGHWGKTNAEWHRELGTDIVGGCGQVCREVRKKTERDVNKSGSEMTTIYKTPLGELKMIDHFDEASQSWHPVVFPVKTKEDIKTMTVWYADAEVVFDKEALEQAKSRYAEIGDSAYVIGSIGTSAMQWFIQHLAGVENAHYFLADYPDEVKELFAAMHKILVARAKLEAEHSPADTLHLTENTSTTLTSPSQYETLGYPHVKEYCDIAKAAGRDMMIHMCGHLKIILPLLNTLKASSFEAFTSPTVGNTTFFDGRKACPDKCLIGGPNAYVWLWPAKKIIEYLEQQLDALPHHRGIFPSSAGVMPPLCAPETIRTVKQWLNGYRIRV